MSKRCSCGKIYTEIPANAIVISEGTPCDGVWWTCECCTTLFIPASKPTEFPNLSEL